MEQTTSKKHLLKSLVPILLVAALFLSWVSPLSAHADTPVFSGVAAAQAEEGQPFDLLSGVSAVDTDGHPLTVTVSQVTSENEPISVPDAVLTMGPAGTSYQVEYQAVSEGESAERFTAQRTVESIAPTEEQVPTPDTPAMSPEEPQLTDPDAVLPDNGSAPESEVPESSASEQEITPDTTLSAPLSGEMQTENGLPIIFQNGLHYITDPDYPTEPIILYCMNNNLAWPHSTIEHPNVPNYTGGYLTPDRFESQAQYDEFIAKLRKILFAGYPYNSERLYKLVPEGELHTPTEREFNNMLILPPQLERDFPQLAHHKFTLKDLNNPKHYAELQDFVSIVRMLYPDKKTEHGLSYNDITSTPFYKAAFSMTYMGSDVTKEDVLMTFAQLYSKSYFVTHSQAYDSTSNAVWKLMYDYGIESNDLSSLNHDPLAETLYQYCQHGDLLDYEPSSSEVHVEGDLSFNYNPKDGMWHSGKLKIVEPKEYNGLYHLDLPEGVTAICEDASHIYANEEYELISATQPKPGAQFRVYATIDWIKDMRQYSPINSTEFQHMVGAIIRRTGISLTLNYQSDAEGRLEISKIVTGNADDQQDIFSFTMILDQPISNQYGDLTFNQGVANFTLTNGETIVVDHLPAGIAYKITEASNENYRVAYSNAEGTVPSNGSVSVVIENTKLNPLSISKMVQGEMGDKTKPFHFDITLETTDGVPFNGTFTYAVFSADTEVPTEESLAFTDGKATVTLTHDQEALIKGIPYGYKYTVTEQEANQDGYSTTYNQSSSAASGALDAPTEIQVVNTKVMVPPTGIHDSGMGEMMVGICLAAVGVAIPLFYGTVRRKRGQHHG